MLKWGKEKLARGNGCPSDKAKPEEESEDSVTQGPAWTSTLHLRKLLPAQRGLAEAPWRQLLQRDLVFVYRVSFISGSEK